MQALARICKRMQGYFDFLKKTRLKGSMVARLKKRNLEYPTSNAEHPDGKGRFGGQALQGFTSLYKAIQGYTRLIETFP
jgi:hypothetical protein